jgi:ATP-dependent RNA helicase DeaD
LKTFSELQVPDSIKRAISAMKFEIPTPIQAQAIPVALSHRDLVACAQTGSGKTAAFGIPVIAALLKQQEKTCLVLVPTRELASQVNEVLKELTQFIPELKTTVLIGGVPMPPQFRALQKRPRIIVATPGRLVDHLRRGSLSLSKAGILVLDEADRMLDLGFAPQINEALRFLPKARQTLLFSATLPADILKLASKYLHDPIKIQIKKTVESTPKISQRTIEVNQQQKNGALLSEVNARTGTILVFTRTKSRTDRLARYLENFGVSVARIHGGRSQSQRVKALNGFRDGSVRILVATDIAARGIDIDHVAHVINYDIPRAAEDYIHRIGRTGRAGREGQALSLLTTEDRPTWKAIQKLMNQN